MSTLVNGVLVGGTWWLRTLAFQEDSKMSLT